MRWRATARARAFRQTEAATPSPANSSPKKSRMSVMEGGLALLENGPGNLDSPLPEFLHHARDDAGGDKLPGNLPSRSFAPPAGAAGRSKRKMSCNWGVVPSMPTISAMLSTRRTPSSNRRTWTIRCRAETICSRMAREGRSSPAIKPSSPAAPRRRADCWRGPWLSRRRGPCSSLAACPGPRRCGPRPR